MDLLFSYLRKYRALILLALVLAATNQVFSLLDPLIFRHVIDDYATRFREYETSQFIKGAGTLLLMAMGVAFVSRVAKNFQDYYVNVIVQRVGAEMYSDGIRHSLELPYSVFEDQRSGETLGKLQKVRSDVERFISLSINLIFTTLVGVVFVVIYALSVHWIIVPAFLATVPLLGTLSWVLSGRVKTIQKVIVAETTALAGSTTESLRNIELVKSLGLADQEVVRLNATRSDVVVLLTTFTLTVLVDLTVAIEVGMVLAAFLFMRRMAEVTNISVVTRELAEARESDDDDDPNSVRRRKIPRGVEVFEINGPFFFGAAEQFKDTLGQIAKNPKVLIIRMRDVPAIDSTGLHALHELAQRCKHDGTLLLLADVHAQPMFALVRSDMLAELGEENLFGNLDSALDRARQHLGLPAVPHPAEAVPTVARETPQSETPRIE